LMEYGVDTRHITKLANEATGHANIAVADDGENQIIIYPGTNRMITDDMIGGALAVASPGDILVMQNETNGQLRAAKIAKKMGLNVVYAAAPFEAEAVTSVLPYTDLLVLNAVEANQLKAVLGRSLKDLDVHNIVVTQGGDGSCWIDALAKLETHIPAISVASVDTTGAGDTFTGFLVAGLDRGLPMMQSLNLATQAAALMVTRFGTADVIPDLKEIEEARLG